MPISAPEIYAPAKPGSLAELVGAEAAPPLSGDDVHLWLFTVPVSDQALRQTIAGLLDAAELARAARFVYAADRRRQVQARGILRLLLGNYLARDPRSISFRSNAHGKPVLSADAGLHFNLSHTQERVLVGLTRRATVGVDLERVRSLPMRDALAAHCCSGDEQVWLAGQPVDTRDRDFLRIWTVKEAVLKALGTGLAIAPESLSVHFPEAEMQHPEVTGAGSPWTLFSAYPDAEHVIAAGVRATIRSERIRCFRFASEGADLDQRYANCTPYDHRS